jgi:hypothetical protein
MEAFMRIVLLSLIGWCFFSGAAHAACSNPVGGPGDIIYNTDHGVVQFCDDTDWWSMKAGGSSSSSVIVGNELAACDLSRRGQLRYDQLTTWEYCNGTAWVVIDTTSTDEIQTLAQVLAQSNDAGGTTVTNLPAPSANSDAATKDYVDTAVAGAGVSLPTWAGYTATSGDGTLSFITRNSQCNSAFPGSRMMLSSDISKGGLVITSSPGTYPAAFFCDTTTSSSGGNLFCPEAGSAVGTSFNNMNCSGFSDGSIYYKMYAINTLGEMKVQTCDTATKTACVYPP